MYFYKESREYSIPHTYFLTVIDPLIVIQHYNSDNNVIQNGAFDLTPVPYY